MHKTRGIKKKSMARATVFSVDGRPLNLIIQVGTGSKMPMMRLFSQYMWEEMKKTYY